MTKRICTLILLIIVPLTVLFANKENDEYKSRFWGTETFKEVTIPEEYKSSSCVILNRSFEYTIDPIFALGPKRIEVSSSLHVRIKLLDKAGVTEFTTFSFDGDTEKARSNKKLGADLVFAGFKVIKSDGHENEINLDEMMVTDEAEKGRAQAQLNKISIPNLEVGDILDYYIVRKNKTIFKYASYVSNSHTFFLESGYPIIEQSVTLNSYSDCYLSCRSMNGAPEMKRIEKKGAGNTFRLEDANRGARKEEMWANPYLESPFVKFQGIFSTSTANKFYHNFLTSTQELRTTISQEELFEYGKNFPKWKKNQIPYSIPRIKLPTSASDKEKVDQILMECKRRSVGMYYEDGFFNANNRSSWNPDYMSMILCKLLSKHKIKSSLIFTTNNYEFRLDDLFMKEDINPVVKIECDGDFFYVSDLEALTNYTEIDPRYAGNKGYELDIYPKPKQKGFREVTIPKTTTDFNNVTTTLEVALDLDSLKSTVDYHKKMLGATKAMEIYEIVGKHDFFNAFAPNFPEIKFTQAVMGKSYVEKRKKQLSDLEKSFSEDRVEYIKNSLKEEYGISNEITFDNFKLNSIGFSSQDRALDYALSFSNDQFIRKVGPNYILDAGKLIGSQVSFSETEKTNRQYSVFNPFPRSYTNIIEIQIPKGYRVKGIETFNANEESEVGGFASAAKIEGDTVFISTNKYYKQVYSPGTDFDQYVSFIDCAFNLTQKQLLFEKIE